MQETVYEKKMQDVHELRVYIVGECERLDQSAIRQWHYRLGSCKSKRTFRAQTVKA